MPVRKGTVLRAVVWQPLSVAKQKVLVYTSKLPATYYFSLDVHMIPEEHRTILNSRIFRLIGCIVRMIPALTLQEGAQCEATLATLLREASAGHPTSTTLQFFAELARHRGFIAAEVDQAWAYLEKTRTEEMALAFCTY